MTTVAPQDWRRHTYALLARHDDPLLREMGAQLSAGALRPSDLLTDPSYRNALARSLRRVRLALRDVEVGRHRLIRVGDEPPVVDRGEAAPPPPQTGLRGVDPRGPA